MNCFAPVYTDRSKILILGSFPSPESFKSGFYYGHPRNRFWPLMAKLLNESVPISVQEKKELLIKRDIALWDVLDSCEIKGASDASIRRPVVNDVVSLTENLQIRAIFFNGAKSEELFARYCPKPLQPSFRMPSTSPANAAWNMDRLYKSWKEILPFLEN